MSPEVFRLAPTSGVDLNPMQFGTRANTFASSATDSCPYTLLVVRVPLRGEVRIRN